MKNVFPFCFTKAKNREGGRQIMIYMGFSKLYLSKSVSLILHSECIILAENKKEGTGFSLYIQRLTLVWYFCCYREIDGTADDWENRSSSAGFLGRNGSFPDCIKLSENFIAR